MSTWTLLDIINKIRNITGTPSTDQLTNAQITDYVNNYYAFTMPFELKEQVQLEPLSFNALPNQMTYSFPGTFLTDQPMAYADGMPLIFYQDQDIFYQDWPQQYITDNLFTGNGIISTFATSLQSPPIVAGSCIITDGTQIAQDDGTGGFTGNVTAGTINYITGVFSVTFTNPPAASATIYAKYIGYEVARPQGVLFFNNIFTLWPIPDQVYIILMQGYINPTQLVNNADTPTFPEWGQLLAYGASLDIFSDRGDLQKYNETYPLLKRFENVALGRTVQQYQSQQSVPRF